MQDDLLFLYQQLRDELEVAYAARAWDGRRIDHITRDMLAMERRLGSTAISGGGGGPPGTAAWPAGGAATR